MFWLRNKKDNFWYALLIISLSMVIMLKVWIKRVTVLYWLFSFLETRCQSNVTNASKSIGLA